MQPWVMKPKGCNAGTRGRQRKRQWGATGKHVDIVGVRSSPATYALCGERPANVPRFVISTSGRDLFPREISPRGTRRNGGEGKSSVGRAGGCAHPRINGQLMLLGVRSSPATYAQPFQTKGDFSSPEALRIFLRIKRFRNNEHPHSWPWPECLFQPKGALS